jgi:hypothetical protein
MFIRRLSSGRIHPVATATVAAGRGPLAPCGEDCGRAKEPQ